LKGEYPNHGNQFDDFKGRRYQQLSLHGSHVSVLVHTNGTHMSVNPSKTCGTAIIISQLDLTFAEENEIVRKQRDDRSHFFLKSSSLLHMTLCANVLDESDKK